ncbi:MAG: hypothetical protein AAGJ79_08910 [Verrucomicrobiota bacterium]
MRTILTLSLAVSTGAMAADPPVQIEIPDTPGALVNQVVIPVPREVFLSLDKLGARDWAGQIRETDYRRTGHRSQVALLFGVCIADGFLAVQAEDSLRVEDIGRSVIRLSHALAVSDVVIEHARAISEFGQKNDWDGVRRELDLIENNVREKMRALDDEPVAQLISAGGWLRGTDAVSSILASDYAMESAEVLRQPEIVRHFARQMKTLPLAAKRNEVVRSVDRGLGRLEPLLEANGGVPSEEGMQQISQILSGLVNTIITNGK